MSVSVGCLQVKSSLLSHRGVTVPTDEALTHSIWYEDRLCSTNSLGQHFEEETLLSLFLFPYLPLSHMHTHYILLILL